MPRVLAPILLCLHSALAASGADLGLGVSLRNDTATVFLPVNLGPRLRIEGSLAFDHGHQSANFPATNGIATQRTSSDMVEVAIGGYARRSFDHGLAAYYGPRLRYGRTRSSYDFQGNDPGSAQPVQSHGEVQGDSLGLAAVLGLEFYASRAFSIAGEAAFGYTRSRGDLPSIAINVTSVGSIRTERMETTTALVARYFF